MDPAEYAHIDALQAEVFWHRGREQLLLVQQKPDPDEPPVWTVYAVLHADEDGFNGLESIDGAGDYAEAKQIAVEMAAEVVAI